MSPFETHKPVLEYALLKQGRSVLEVGGGEASTPLIVKHSASSLTLENNKEWYERISGYGDEQHKISYQPNLMLYVIFGLPGYVYGHDYTFSLALVDNDVWKERCEIVNYMKNNHVAEVILLHDSFDEHLHRCTECGHKLPEFKYSLNLYPYLPPNPSQPPTLILSDSVDVTKWEVPGLTVA